MFVEPNPGYMLAGRCGAAFEPACSYALTGEVTSMAGMFHDATYYLGLSGLMKYNLTTANVEDTSAVAFNQDIGGWNTAEVLSMQVMFDGAKAFNQDIGGWDTAKVKYMRRMFYSASVFNQNIGTWNTAKVTEMYSTFDSASAFNQDIGSWNTAAVTSMGSMFYSASAFNQDIGSWNTAEVKGMGYMFDGAKDFKQDVGSWNTAALQYTDGMFGAQSAMCYRHSGDQGRLCPRMQMDKFCVSNATRMFVSHLCQSVSWPPVSEGHIAYGSALPDFPCLNGGLCYDCGSDLTG